MSAFLKIMMDDFCRWPTGFWQAIGVTSYESTTTDHGAYLKVLTGHKTVVETSLSRGAYCQSHSPIWKNAMPMLTHCPGEMLLRADYTPIILDTYLNTTTLIGEHGYTVMHADLYLEVAM